MLLPKNTVVDQKNSLLAQDTTVISKHINVNARNTPLLGKTRTEMVQKGPKLSNIIQNSFQKITLYIPNKITLVAQNTTVFI